MASTPPHTTPPSTLHTTLHTSTLHTSHLHTTHPPCPGMAPTLQFRARSRGGSLRLQVVSCQDLPDADAAGIGFGNKSDPYVVVRVGEQEQRTRAISGKLSPEFPKASSTFTFDVGGDPTSARVSFKVMDKDTFTSDDLIGQAKIKLSAGQLNGVLLSLRLVVQGEEDSDSEEE